MLSTYRARDVTVVRVLPSHQCGPVSNPGINAISGWSLLLVLYFAPSYFSPGTPVFHSTPKTIIFKFQFNQERQTKNLSVDGNPKCANCRKAGAQLVQFVQRKRPSGLHVHIIMLQVKFDFRLIKFLI